MKKMIKKWGNSVGILITSEECKIYGLKNSDIVDIELVKIKGKKWRKEST